MSKVEIISICLGILSLLIAIISLFCFLWYEIWKPKYIKMNKSTWLFRQYIYFRIQLDNERVFINENGDFKNLQSYYSFQRPILFNKKMINFIEEDSKILYEKNKYANTYPCGKDDKVCIYKKNCHKIIDYISKEHIFQDIKYTVSESIEYIDLYGKDYGFNDILQLKTLNKNTTSAIYWTWKNLKLNDGFLAKTLIKSYNNMESEIWNRSFKLEMLWSTHAFEYFSDMENIDRNKLWNRFIGLVIDFRFYFSINRKNLKKTHKIAIKKCLWYKRLSISGKEGISL